MDISNMEIQTFRQLRYEKKTVGFYVIKTDVFCFTLPRYFKHVNGRIGLMFFFCRNGKLRNGFII